MFSDQAIQNSLDDSRDEIRYEGLTIAPSIVNNALTGHQAVTVFADYYSKYKWWEVDASTGDGVFLQGYQNGQAWVLITPTLFEPIVGHWQFENDVFTTGTSVPGQLPPVFATGRIYDPFYAAADLLENWAAMLANRYDVTADGQTLRRSQLMSNKLTLANLYRRQSKPKVAKMNRSDVMSPLLSSRRLRLLDEDDRIK